MFSNRSLASWDPGQTLSMNVGTATTGPDGRAEFVAAAGVNGLVAIRDDRLVGYIVEFRPLTSVGGVQYCRSRAEAVITVEG